MAPRPLAAALEATLASVAPKTPLAAVQAAWPEVAGAAITAEAEAVAERGGTVTFRCSTASWANELELLAPDLLARLRAAIGPERAGRLERLRFTTGTPRGSGLGRDL